MDIGDKVKIINTGDIWENKSGTLEYLDDYMATVLVDFIDDKKVRQDFNVENVVPFEVSIEIEEEPAIMSVDEESPKLEEDLKMNVEEIKQKLADYLDVDVEEIDQGWRDDVFTVGSEREYLVCTEDEAREKAEEEVRRSFEEMGLEAFTDTFQEWILANAVDGSVFDDMQHEYYMQYVDDIEYENDDEFENRLYFELFENGLLKEEDFEGEDHVGSSLKDEIYDHLDSLKSEYVDILCNSEDPLDFINNMYSGRDLADFIMDNNAIDIDKVAEEAVDEDGCGHFLSYYDGEERDLGDGLLAYRLN